MSYLDLPWNVASGANGQSEPPNVIAALVEAMSKPEFYDFVVRKGELFITPKASKPAIS